MRAHVHEERHTDEETRIDNREDLAWLTNNLSQA